MKLTNKAMLVTYADSLAGDLKETEKVIDSHFNNAVGGIHILPFFPSSGDRGFAPMEYDHVDPAFGDWDDIERLSSKYYLMCDFMANHISKRSAYFQDFLEKKSDSPYADYFINYREFWKGEPSQEDYDKLYRRKPRAPYIEEKFKDGSIEKIWCTFGEEQVDLDLSKKKTREFVEENLGNLVKRGLNLIRLDAVAYGSKRPGTACFFVEPDIWELLGWIDGILEESGADFLPEIHHHFSVRDKLASHGYWTYDFALPMLVLHALYSGSAGHLSEWLTKSPRRQFTTLDTHDGIGILDVGGLLTEEEIDFTKNAVYSKGSDVKPEYNTVNYNNLDIYQLNCTYYSALGNDDKAYLIARAIQVFAPGIPQIYYVGLLAGKNDLVLLEETREGRNINRHYYDPEEIESEMKRPIVQKILHLLEFRNTFPAFALDGEIEVTQKDGGSTISIIRTKDNCTARLEADLVNWDLKISYGSTSSAEKQLFVN